MQGYSHKAQSIRSIHYTKRDLAVLRWMGEQYLARLDQVALLLARGCKTEEQPAPGVVPRLSVSRTKSLLTRWQKAGLIEKEQILYKQPLWAWLTVEGLAQVDLPFRSVSPRVGQLEHLYYVNQARLLLEGQRPTLRWQSERAFRSEETSGIGGRGHWPDGVVINEDGKAVAVEVELQHKGHRRVREIVYESLQHYQTIWYFIAPHLRPMLEEIKHGLGERGDYLLLYDLQELSF